MSLQAVLDALRFHGGSTEGLRKVSEAAWPALFRETDEQAVSLALANIRDRLPDTTWERLDRNLADNALRHRKLVAACEEINRLFAARGVEFILLKGLSRWPDFCSDLTARPSYDIDLYCPPGCLQAGFEALRELGYEPLTAGPDSEADHLPRMVRRTGWTWRGNYFDPEMPLAVELHHRFWDEQTERFRAGDANGFWERRVVREIAGIQLPVLASADALTYAAWHLVRHLLRGALKLQHVLEVAFFLEKSVADQNFWEQWSGRPAGDRLVEAISFRLATAWFGCRIHPLAATPLPEGIERWFACFGDSALLVTQGSRKSELWLHLCLAEAPEDRRRIVRRKLFPARRGGVTLNPHVPEDSLTLRLRLANAWFAAGFLARRCWFHATALIRITVDGWVWWKASRRRQSPGRPPRETRPA